MDNLARLHFEYVVKDELWKKGLASSLEVKEAEKKYNQLLDRAFDRLEKSWPMVPEDFLKPESM